MSIKVMADVWEYATVEGRTLLVLLAIADWANDQGVAYPAIERIAKKARCSIRKVQFAIVELVEHGFLSVQPNAGPHGTNLYTVTLGVQKLHPAKTAPRNPEQAGVQKSSAGVQKDAEGGAKTDPVLHPNRQEPSPLEPSPLEPSLEPSALRAEKLWDAVAAELKPQITKANYDTWVRDCRGVDVDDERLYVLTPSIFAEQWLTKRLLPLIRKAATKCAGREMTVSFVTQPQEGFG